jgi:hypothetical protein
MLIVIRFMLFTRMLLCVLNLLTKRTERSAIRREMKRLTLSYGGLLDRAWVETFTVAQRGGA